MAKVKLISSRKEQTAHVHREKVGAMTASHCHSLEQTAARNTHLKQQQEQEDKEVVVVASLS